MGLTIKRVAGVLVLLATGIMSLPLVAAVLDGGGTENWIAPVQLLVMAATGATVTVVDPALARHGASTGRRALTGVWWGLLAAFLGDLVFWLVISGIDGA